MSFTKIENTDLNGVGVIGLPDQPGLSAAAMQAKFEETARTVIVPKHNGLIDELEDTTAAASIGAVAPTGRTGNTVQAILDDISAFEKIESAGTTFTASGVDTFKINAGSNVTITPLSSPDKGIQISAAGGGGGSTGDMLMSDYDSLGTVKTAGGIPAYVTTAISGKADSSSLATVATSGQYGDLTGTPTLATVATSGSYNDLLNPPTIPDELKDLTDDSTHRLVTDTDKTAWNGKSTVSWSQSYSSGQKIATVTINGTPTDVYAPTGGGGGGGGDVTSVNGQQGDVVLDLNDIDDVTITSASDNDALVYDSGDWVNIPLSTVALTGSYASLSGKPSIPTITDTYSGTSSNGMSGIAVKSAIDALDGTITGSAGTGNTLSAFSQTDGKVSATFSAISITKSQISDLSSETAASGGTTTSLCTTGEKYTWDNKVDTVSVGNTGTASTTAVRFQRIGVGDAGGAENYYEVNGSKYMETTANSTSYVFTNTSHIFSTSAIDVYSDTWGDNPSNVVVDGSNHTCTVTFASAASRTVRIYIK